MDTQTPRLDVESQYEATSEDQLTNTDEAKKCSPARSPYRKIICIIFTILATILAIFLIWYFFISEDEKNSNPYAARASKIVSSMSLSTAAAQMTQVGIDYMLNEDATLNEDKVRELARIGVGSYLNSPFATTDRNQKYGWNVTEWRDVITRIQAIAMEENSNNPMIYGLDSVHGANYLKGAVLFGHNINTGSTFNPKFAYEVGRITGRDTAAMGIPWVFAPTIDISVNPMWARTPETFSEDPYMTAVMGEAAIKGLQSNPNTAACMKHFIGYSVTPSGYDRDGVTLSDFDLLNYHAPPFIAAIKAGAMSAMENYVSINGEPVISSTKILKNLIRDDMGFTGVIVGDWSEVTNLHGYHKVAKSDVEAVEMVLKSTSLDMSMVPYDASFHNMTMQVLEDNPDLESRIRESAQRIIELKLKLGLYDTPVPGEENVGLIRNNDDVEIALNLARESIILLENNNESLPLPSNDASVFLTGLSSDDIGHLCGGWSISWQGYSGNDMYPDSIKSLKGAMEEFGGDNVQYFNGIDFEGNISDDDLETSKSMAGSSNYTVITIGEMPYAEKFGDILDWTLPEGQIKFVQEMYETGTKVIVIYVGGRPRLLGDIKQYIHAFINAWWPCEQGGQALAEILYGKVNPSGRMPITYPSIAPNVMMHYNKRVNTVCNNFKPCETEWDFGRGLSYTEFEYSDMSLSTTTVTSSTDSVSVSVKVTNKGKMAGKETVMLFLIQPYRLISVPEVKQLKKFDKIMLKPGESKVVMFELRAEDWSVYDPQIGQGMKRIAEDGDFVVAIKPDTVCEVYWGEDAVDNAPLCARFTLNTTNKS